MSVNSDFSDLLFEVTAAEVRYLIVGAHAVFFYAEPRFTNDLDVWAEPSPDNAGRVMTALKAFGAPLGELKSDDFSSPGIF